MDSRINIDLASAEKFAEEEMPTMTNGTPLDVPRGLAGVVVTDTALGDVRGREGFYHYRQYSAIELARTRSFEDVWYLMFHGELPGPAARAPRAPPPCGGCRRTYGTPCRP
ncbi:hypothetical protein GCM10018966_050140 [Streptomyces yanii]